MHLLARSGLIADRSRSLSGLENYLHFNKLILGNAAQERICVMMAERVGKYPPRTEILNAAENDLDWFVCYILLALNIIIDNRLNRKQLSEEPEEVPHTSWSVGTVGEKISHQEQLISLHKFNEIAQKLGHTVNFHYHEVQGTTWNAECIGESLNDNHFNHTHECIVIVNGVSQGKGSGKDKASAKVASAQKAYQALGWTD